MKSGLKLLGIMAVTAGVGLAGNAAFANCQGEGPYEVRQCAKRTWFAPVPAGGQIASAQWWAIGFANFNSNQPSTSGTVAPEGSAFLAVPPLPGNFIGADSGGLDRTGVDLADADLVPGVGGPPGSTCFSSAANWGTPGMDSCIDINRNSTAGGGALNVSDNYVNPYWSNVNGGPYYKYYDSLLDPPMGVLLKDNTGTQMALAFFASEPRPKNPAGTQQDITSGQYNMGLLFNGDSGPTGANVVPWQPIPKPTIGAVLANPADPNSARNLTVTWTPIRLVTDNSVRPCIATDGVTPCPVLAPLTGVGVNDQGPLVHYDLESAPLVGGTCGTFTLLNSVNHPANTMNATVPPNTCVRLSNRFGRTGSDPCNAATTTCRDQRRLAAQTGKMGDLGASALNAVGGTVTIGGPAVSQNAVLTVATKNKNTVTIGWTTTSEVNVTGFDIVGIDGKGTKKVVVSSVACRQCTSGLGATYTELIPGNKFQGSKKVQIVMQPSGTTSNTLDLN